MRKRSATFVIITLAFFIAGFLLYGVLLGHFSPDKLITNSIPDTPDFSKIIKMGCFGGYFISSLFCGAYIVVKGLKKMNLVAKITSAIFFPITILIMMLWGHIALIPYTIVNIVRIFKKRI